MLCFLPSAFGQSPVNSATHSVRTYQTPNFLAFALTSGSDLYNKGGKSNNGGGNNGWNNNGGNGGACSYSDGKGEKCAAVPEGGTPIMYLLLAGFSCLGAMVLRSRRQVRTPETN